MDSIDGDIRWVKCVKFLLDRGACGVIPYPVELELDIMF